MKAIVAGDDWRARSRDEVEQEVKLRSAKIAASIPKAARAGLAKQIRALVAWAMRVAP